MNWNTSSGLMPCGASAAENAYQNRLARNERREAELKAEWPLSEFLDDALAILHAEDGHELLCDLTDYDNGLMPALLVVILHGCDLGHLDTSSIELEKAKRNIARHILSRLDDEQERLQDKFIDEEMS